MLKRVLLASSLYYNGKFNGKFLKYTINYRNTLVVMNIFPAMDVCSAKWKGRHFNSGKYWNKNAPTQNHNWLICFTGAVTCIKSVIYESGCA
jgi:hypothetical protein